MAIPKPVVTQQMRSADPEVANFIETTDATGPTFGATVVGGGAVFVPVYSDGTNWIVG